MRCEVCARHPSDELGEPTKWCYRPDGRRDTRAGWRWPALSRSLAQDASSDKGAGDAAPEVVDILGPGAYIVGMALPLGEFEVLILMAVLRLDGDGYAPTIRSEIEGRTSRKVARGAVYVTLNRLEAKGLLGSRTDDSADAGGKPRGTIACCRKASGPYAGPWRPSTK